jgi:hypothetical protein
MKSPTGVEIAVGQKWREVDPRFTRVVEVVGTDHLGFLGIGAVQIQTVYPEKSARRSWARLSRFNGKRGGYALEAA